MTLTRAQLIALTILADGPARQSNRTDPEARTVSWRTVNVLEDAGLAIDVARFKAILTDAGREVAADPPEPPPLRYEHGTHACYVLDGCRCNLCGYAAAQYESRRQKDQAYGRSRTVDADPIRQHVRSLMADRKRGATNGVGLKQIVKVSGVAQGTLWKLMYGAPDRDGPSKRVRRETAEKLLAIGPQHMADGARVPAKGTRARLQELRDAGATWTELGEQIGKTPANTHKLSTQKNVNAGTARTIHALHERWKSGEWVPEGRRPGGHAKAKAEREAADA